ncbi:MAG: ABC transporter substrate-binding protein [Bacteroidetes bacterium]|nr:ABC transporter substrate-binding protein [Bacteroidota bacterium]
MRPGIRIGKIAVIILFFSLSACNNPAHRHADKKVFRYNEPGGITSLDPAFANNDANTRACMQLYNGLVQADSQLHIQPCIAKSWEIGSRGQVFVFHLRTDVYFHENNSFDVREEFDVIHNKNNPIRVTRKVIAKDFIYSFKRLTDPLIASPCRWVMDRVQRDSLGKISGIEAIDDSTLRITLDRPFTPFLSMLSMVSCSVVPQEVVDYFGADFRSHPCGTGPFLFRIWKPDMELVFLKNENYFESNLAGERLPFLDAIEISFIPEKENAFIEFLKGNLDLINGIDGPIRDQLLSRTGQLQPRFAGKFNFETSPFLNTEYLSIVNDCDKAKLKSNPLCDKRIRQALSYGFYRRNLSRYLSGNIGVAGIDGIVPPGLPSYDSSIVVGYYYYSSKVRALLKEAGHEDGKDLPEIVLHTNIEARELCEYVQKQWEEFGINVSVDLRSHEEQMQLIDEGRLSFFRSSWIADYPDAENFLGLFYSKNIPPNGHNYTHFSNKDYDEIYEKAMEETNDSARYVLYRYMDQLLMEYSPVIIVYYDQSIRITQLNISGLSHNAMGHLSLKLVQKN